MSDSRLYESLLTGFLGAAANAKAERRKRLKPINDRRLELIKKMEQQEGHLSEAELDELDELQRKCNLPPLRG